MPTNRLGKGLDALIPNIIPNTQLIIEHIPIGDIRPNPFQPRKTFSQVLLRELADSIKQHGLTQPIVVRKKTTGYELVVGERRLEACKLINQETIPAIIKDITDQMSCEVSLVENIDREDLNVIETAHAFKRLIDEFSHTQESLAKIFSRSRSSIANILRLTKLPKSIQKMVVDRDLSEGHARTLIDYSDDEAFCLQLANDIKERRMSVRQTEQFIKTFKKTPKQVRNKTNLFDNYVEKLSERLNTDVKITHRKNELSISVGYQRFKDYIEFLDQLCKIEIHPFES